MASIPALDGKDSLPETLELFRRHLPRKPYHTDDLASGIYIAGRDRAAQSRYIQPNGPTQLRWLLYDVDRPGAALDWSERNAPPPTITAMNHANGHAHLLYLLEEPVCKSEAARPEPLRYAAAVDCALREKLDADQGYSGLIVKNPLRRDVWAVGLWEVAPYSLGDLDSWLDLNKYKDRRRNLPDYGLGRNCTLFNRVSKWARRAIRQGWPELDRWMVAVHTNAEGQNLKFDTPLPPNEVKHIARSVAKWTHRHMTPAGFEAYVARTHTPEIQAQRGARKGAKRREELMPKVLELVGQGKSQREIAEALGIPRKTIGDWLRR
ncbi:replication initiation protein [uncultured Halomonas sp.]|uniref:replication initiation protein n=1 Tax=uncultured Halomonas sp. TaxID=173971 RepID=UPI00262D2FE5|nr:replication initiation protein [uncultured Halomonas sp.]